MFEKQVNTLLGFYFTPSVQHLSTLVHSPLCCLAHTASTETITHPNMIVVLVPEFYKDGECTLNFQLLIHLAKHARLWVDFHSLWV